MAVSKPEAPDETGAASKCMTPHRETIPIFSDAFFNAHATADRISDSPVSVSKFIQPVCVRGEASEYALQ
jgi:hypothetical protein